MLGLICAVENVFHKVEEEIGSKTALISKVWLVVVEVNRQSDVTEREQCFLWNPQIAWSMP